MTKIKDFVILSTSSIYPKENIVYNLYSLPAFDNEQKCEILRGKDIQSNKYIVPDKCILFNKLNVRFKRVWRIDSLEEHKLCSTEFLPLIIDETKVDYQYFFYLLISDSITNYLCGQNANTSGSHKRISPADLLEIPVKLPSMPEQKAIGKILSDIDSKIALNKAINHNLAAMAKQLYDYWFVQFDFPNQDGKPYKSNGGKMVWNEKLKREIPEGWEATTFVSLIKNSRNGDWGKETIIGNYTEKVYCIRGTDINGLKGKERIKLPTRFILKKNNEKYLSENEFVVEISGGSPTQSTGRIILLTRKIFERFDSNIICSNFCKSISLKEKKYIFFFLQEWERLYNNRTLFDYEGKTSGIKNFLFDDFINSYKIILPSKNIVEKFYSYSENIDNKLQESLKEIESLSKQRDELLPLLMNGQVTIG